MRIMRREYPDIFSSIVDRVVKLLQDRELHRRISKNAHTLVEKKFSWEKGVELLEEMLEKVVTES